MSGVSVKSGQPSMDTMSELSRLPTRCAVLLSGNRLYTDVVLEPRFVSVIRAM